MNQLAKTFINHPVILWLLKILSIVFYPIFDYSKVTPVNTHKKQTEHKLFPKCGPNRELKSSIKPCSTGEFKYIPIKNEYGEIEWEFSDDMVANSNFEVPGKHVPIHDGQELDWPFGNDGSSINSDFFDLNHSSQRVSPVTSVSSEFDNAENKNITSSPNNSVSPYGSKLHQCPHCDATFKLRGYLTRHLKKHSIQKAYRCPFHIYSTYIDENNVTHKCHPTGGFSRRDTYKTHLKSRHFKYPKGTLTKQRCKSAGHCGMCGEYFESSEIWCEIHVEGGECKYLPDGFKGKSRIKNKLRKELKKSGLNEDEFLSTLHTHSSPQSQNSDLDFHKLAKHRQLKQQTPDNEDTTLRMDPYSHSQQFNSNNMHEHIYSSNIDSQPIESPEQMSSQVSSTMESPTQTISSQVNPRIESPVQAMVSSDCFPVNINPKLQGQLYNQGDVYFNMLDYDDDFCLDMDQRAEHSNQPIMFTNQISMGHVNHMGHLIPMAVPQIPQMWQTHPHMPSQMYSNPHAHFGEYSQGYFDDDEHHHIQLVHH